MSSGDGGVIIDKHTGERLKNVLVEFEANNGDTRNAKSDTKGYYNVFQYRGCGIKKCPETWTITFSMDSFKTQIIDQTYSSKETTTLLSSEFKDTVVVELERN